MGKYVTIIGTIFVVIVVILFIIGCSDTKSTYTATGVSTNNAAITTTGTEVTTLLTTSQIQTTSSSSNTKSASNWNLNLVGVITENVNQTLFAKGSAPGCHAAYWTDTGGHIWSGISLWLLAAFVDDNNPMGVPNTALWNQGFGVLVSASDGSMVEYTSDEIENNNNIILAYQLDGKPLPGNQWPLALVGSAVDSQHQLGMITGIKLIISSKTTTTEIFTRSQSGRGDW